MLLRQHKDIGYLRGLSPAIWGRLPLAHWANGVGGYYFFDDFADMRINEGNDSAGTLTVDGKYEIYGDANSTLVSASGFTLSDPSGFTAASDDDKAGYDVDTDYAVGSLVLTDEDTNGESGIHQPTNPFLVRHENLRRLAFEARIAMSSVTDSQSGLFVGLSNIQPDDDALVDSTGEIEADAAAVGFSVLDADGDQIRPTISENGGTITRYGTASDGGAAGALSKAVTAAKYIKVGFLLDPMAPPAKRVKFFIDGEEQTDSLTVNYLSQTVLEGANFPSNSAMGLTLLHKSTGATNTSATIDWWAAAMEIDRL